MTGVNRPHLIALHKKKQGRARDPVAIHSLPDWPTYFMWRRLGQHFLCVNSLLFTFFEVLLETKNGRTRCVRPVDREEVVP